MSTMVRKWNHSFVLFAIVLLCSAVSLNAQFNDTLHCNTKLDCGNWTLEIKSIPLTNFPACSVTVSYYKRVCSDGTTQIQPAKIYIPRSGGCLGSPSAWSFYVPPAPNNSLPQMKAKMEALWSDVLNNLPNILFLEEMEESGNPTEYICPNTKKWTIMQPACRGLCIVYKKTGVTFDTIGQESQWISCNENCCETKYSLCWQTGPSARVIKVLDEVNQLGDMESCDTNSPTDPDDYCTATYPIVKYYPYKCQDYCQETSKLQFESLIERSETQSSTSLDRFRLSTYTNVLSNYKEFHLVSKTERITLVKRDGIQNLTLFDMNNSKVINLNLSELKDGEQFELDISKLTNGLYMIYFEFQSQQFTKQLLIHR